MATYFTRHTTGIFPPWLYFKSGLLACQLKKAIREGTITVTPVEYKANIRDEYCAGELDSLCPRTS